VSARAPVAGAGFTLVEVMVALAIVAIALPALLLALSQQTDDTAYLRDKTMAQVVAANRLAELRLVIAATRNLQAGRSNGVETMVGRDWHWWVETIASPVEKFFRVEIRVALDPKRRDQPLYLLTAFMSSDLDVDAEGLQELDVGGGGIVDGGGSDSGGDDSNNGGGSDTGAPSSTESAAEALKRLEQQRSEAAPDG